MRRRLHLLVVLLACAAPLARAPTALAHAQLLGTSPVSGSTAQREPTEVIFEFNQNVGGTLGAVRVYDAQGNEVDNLDVSHPEGQEHWLGVGLKPHLPDGTYTATYRVISADTHIVYGGLVFNIGHPGATPKFTVAGLIARNKSGDVTEVAFGVVRGLDYLTIALMLGGLAFVAVAWLPGFAAVADAEPEWQVAMRMFAGRMRRLLILAVVLGVARERARHPAARRERSRRFAVGVPEKHGSPEHDRKPVRGGVGPASDRLVGAGSSADGGDGAPAPLAARTDRDRRSVPRGHARAQRPREHPEPDRRVLSRPTCCTCSPRACGSEVSPACCWRCPPRRERSRGRSAAGCCSRRSRASPRLRSPP